MSIATLKPELVNDDPVFLEAEVSLGHALEPRRSTRTIPADKICGSAGPE